MSETFAQAHNRYIAHPMSPSVQPNPFDAAAVSLMSGRTGPRSDAYIHSAILVRRLSPTTSDEALRSMLIFAKDCVGAEFVPSSAEDLPYLTALARFRSQDAALEARAMLDGKPTTDGALSMSVEIIQPSPAGSFGRRHTLEHQDTRSSDSSAASSSNPLSRQTSRFSDAFQALDRGSPPRGSHQQRGRDPQADGMPSSYQNCVSPQSPIGPPLERRRVSGRSVIQEDGVDDETGQILSDPIAFAKNDMAGGINGHPRRSTLPSLSGLPISRFGALSINGGGGGNGMGSPPDSGLASPRGAPLQSPSAFPSAATTNHMGPNTPYQLTHQHYMRASFPPVNPADQNPPCNTLYVGNLPMDTSEDELKAIFSKQRGYRRLCFRTKQNGPMCFVEFEDISFATKALTELYGQPLHNSVKGGIRLSFSKNPLGVRNGQASPMAHPMSAHGPVPGMTGFGGGGGGGGGMMQSFATANGPPPGLAVPPGLNTSHANGGYPNGMGGLFGGPMSPLGNGYASGLQSPVSPTGGGYSGHMFGR